MPDASKPDGAVAALYERAEIALLEDLIGRVESGEATASEKATLAGLLGKAGTPARSAGKGVKGSEEAAMRSWLDGLPEEEQERMKAELRKKAPAPLRRSAGRKKSDADLLGDAA